MGKSARISDYFRIAGATAGSWIFGFCTGKPVRYATASTAATIGFTFGVFHVLQITRARLLGYEKNEREVKIYGMAPAEFQPKKLPPQDPRFPAQQPPTTVKKPIDYTDYKL